MKTIFCFYRKPLAYLYSKRYRNEFGQLLEHSPFCERDIEAPVHVDPIDKKGDFVIKVKRKIRLLISYMQHILLMLLDGMVISILSNLILRISSQLRVGFISHRQYTRPSKGITLWYVLLWPECTITTLYLFLLRITIVTLIPMKFFSMQKVTL